MVWEDGIKINIGDIEMEEDPTNIRVIFKDDNTFIEQTFNGTTWVTDLTGTWTLDGSQLLRRVDSGESLEETEYIQLLTTDRLTLRGLYNGDNEGFDLLTEFRRVTE